MSPKKELSPRTLFLLGVAALVAMFAIATHFYWWFDARLGGAELSVKLSDWADWGSYFGGTAGAIFALFAFLGVLYSIYLQDRQLRLQEEQLNRQNSQLQSQIEHLGKQQQFTLLAEYHQVVIGLSREIDGVMRQQIVIDNDTHEWIRPMIRTVQDMIQLWGGIERKIDEEGLDEETKDKWMAVESWLFLNYMSAIFAVRDGLSNLRMALVQVEEKGGDADLVLLYRNRYHSLARFVWQAKRLAVPVETARANVDYFAPNIVGPDDEPGTLTVNRP